MVERSKQGNRGKQIEINSRKLERKKKKVGRSVRTKRMEATESELTDTGSTGWGNEEKREMNNALVHCTCSEVDFGVITAILKFSN